MVSEIKKNKKLFNQVSTSGENVHFRCLMEEGDQKEYNSKYSSLAVTLAKRSGWKVLSDKHTKMVRGNSKDRLKQGGKVEKTVITMHIPSNLIEMSLKGKFDWYEDRDKTAGAVGDPGTYF